MKLLNFSALGAALAVVLTISLSGSLLFANKSATPPFLPPKGVVITIVIDDVIFRPIPPGGPDIILSPNPATDYILADPDSGVVVTGIDVRDAQGNPIASASVSMPATLTMTLETGRLLFRFNTSVGLIQKWVTIN